MGKRWWGGGGIDFQLDRRAESRHRSRHLGVGPGGRRFSGHFSLPRRSGGAGCCETPRVGEARMLGDSRPALRAVVGGGGGGEAGVGNLWAGSCLRWTCPVAGGSPPSHRSEGAESMKANPRLLQSHMCRRERCASSARRHGAQRKESADCQAWPSLPHPHQLLPAPRQLPGKHRAAHWVGWAGDCVEWRWGRGSGSVLPPAVRPGSPIYLVLTRPHFPKPGSLALLLLCLGRTFQNDLA